MATVGYARVSSVGQSLDVQREMLKGSDKAFKEKRSDVDAGRPELKRCLEYLRDGDTLLVTKIDRLVCSTFRISTASSRSLRRRALASRSSMTHQSILARLSVA